MWMPICAGASLAYAQCCTAITCTGDSTSPGMCETFYDIVVPMITNAMNQQ